MALLKKLAGETAIYGLSSILGRVVNWIILTPYFTRVFEKGEYGIVTDLYFWIAILLVLFTYRMETAFFRFASRGQQELGDENHDQDTVFSTASLTIIGTTVALTGLLFCLAPQIASFLKYPGREDYVRIFTLIIAFDALAAIPFAKLRMESRPLRFAAIKLSALALNILLVFFFLEGCPWLLAHDYTFVADIYNPEHRIAYVFWANLIASGISILWLAPLYRHLAWRFATDLWRRMLNYALPLVIAAIAGIVNQLAGTTLLKYFGTGTTEANLDMGGMYAAAAKLAVLMNLFVQAFNYAAEPFFFRQSAVSQDKAIYADVARAFALVGSLAFVGIMFYLELIQVFLGEDYREGLGVLPILLVANFFLGLYYNFSIGYKLTDQTRWAGYIALFGTVITLVINIIFIPSITIYAPAWASLACFFTMTVAGYWLTRKLWPVDYKLGRMAYYLLLAIAGWGLTIIMTSFLPDQMVYRLIGNSFVFLAILLLLYKTEGNWLRKVLR
ncbi:lipopolysaccharide biosynthesis protein [Lewinella cohaerens]|uniref:lipopolysaccharide biosynthesis protein n=1 Tax=Lewinella cohaerens TaxID=70995 RepID=UPI000369E067|nr:polysaccharide biosynthesis C-terminal domain-containing protein [Lewinella cohaerens]